MNQKRPNPNNFGRRAMGTCAAATFLTLGGWAASTDAQTATGPSATASTSSTASASTAATASTTTSTDCGASTSTTPCKGGKASGAAQLQQVNIVAYRITRGSVGSLVDAPVEDIPRNMDIVTEQTLDNQMVSSTLDILKDFPGVQRGSDAPGAEHPRVRGMAAFQFLEGTYSGGILWDNAEFLSSAELLTGPNSIQYGFLVQGGGAMNYLLKRPTSELYVDTTIQGNNWGDNKYVVDANTPLGSTHGDGLRLIGVHEGITEFRRSAGHGKRNSAAVMLTYTILGIKSDLDYEIVRREAPINPNIDFSKNPSAPFQSIDPRNSIEQPWEKLRRDGTRVGGKFQRNLFGTWRAVFTTSYEDQELVDKSCTLFDPDPITGEGAYSCGTSPSFSAYTNRSYRMDVLGSFHTFGIEHDVTVGASQLKQTIELPNSFDTYGNPPYTADNLYFPRYYPDPTVPTAQSLFDQYRLQQWWTQEYLQDRIRLTKHWDVWAGVNEGDVKAALEDQPDGLLNKTSDNGLSPSFSISYSPKDKLRFYVTYADAISPGGQAPISPQYVNSGERFSPMRFESYETGVKWQVANISQLNLNLFHEEQPLAYIKTLAPNEFLYTEKGKNQFTGVEFTSTSIFPFGLRLTAGFTFLRPLQVDTGDPTQNDKYVPGVSRQSAAVYAEYSVPMIPDLVLTANITYNSSSPLMPQNGYDLGGYTLADLGGFYSHPIGGVDMTYRLIVTNAFDTRYLSPWYSTVTPGAPRTVMASVSARFGGNH